jgi:hypothetical protein
MGLNYFRNLENKTVPRNRSEYVSSACLVSRTNTQPIRFYEAAQIFAVKQIICFFFEAIPCVPLKLIEILNLSLTQNSDNILGANNEFG